MYWFQKAKNPTTQSNPILISVFLYQNCWGFSENNGPSEDNAHDKVLSEQRKMQNRIPLLQEFPCGSAGQESICNVGDLGSINPWVGKIPWRRERLATPVFWPGEFHGLQSYFSLLRHMEANSLPWGSGWAWRLTWPKECGGCEALKLPNQVHQKPCRLPLPQGPPQSSEPPYEVWHPDCPAGEAWWRALVKSSGGAQPSSPCRGTAHMNEAVLDP